jgi:hypothetical protein
MRESIRRIWSGPARSYITFFLLLVGAAVSVAVAMADSGCDGGGGADACTNPVSSSAGWNQTSAPGYTIRAVFDGTTDAAQPGQRATHVLGSAWMKTGTTAAYIWTPPPNASGFVFARPTEPGGPPFVWKGLAPNTSIQVSFYFPQKPAGLVGAWRVTEYFEVQTSDGQNASVVHTTTLGGTAAQAAGLVTGHAESREASGSAGLVWELARWFDFPSTTMDTNTCQTWIDFLSGPQAFFAVRMPVTRTATGAVQVPFVSGADYPSMLRIQRYVPAAWVYTATLELRPERLTFVANALPGAADEQWLPLGVSSDAPACPTGLSIAAGNWTSMGTIFVDLSHRPDDCLGCIQPIYFCYEGQDSPLAMATPTPVQAGSAEASADGITCFGPQAVSIGTGPNWNVMVASSLIAMPPESLRLHHAVSNRTGVERDFNLAYESDLAVNWRMYGGTSTSPNMGEPLGNTVRLADKQVKFIWLISDPLATDTRSGSYSLRFAAALASAPTESRWASDIIWVGEWVAPPTEPPPPPTATATPTEPARRLLWLPVVVK